jgi:ectoine hydroxylase-related dioxygenase (phytanoyl-CoA dioxygenase family)
MHGLTAEDVGRYQRDGFIVVEGVLSADEVRELRDVTDSFVERSRGVATHDDVFDLESSHSPSEPRVRRIKSPHLQHPAYERLVRHPIILGVLRPLLGDAIRFDTSKLNLKMEADGPAVEWHQDWAFYPHTNDDLCAVGVMIDDCELDNGPLLCIPGSHRGPVHDHHSDGVFCGAIDCSTHGLRTDEAVACVGPAGSISVHHVRTVHGSAPNRSPRPRRLLLYQYRAADAWPLIGFQQPQTWEAWSDLLVCGEPDSLVPRCTDVPVRLPLPEARHQGSIYENQRALANRYFTPN